MPCWLLSVMPTSSLPFGLLLGAAHSMTASVTSEQVKRSRESASKIEVVCFFVIALLRYNLYTVKFTHSISKIQYVLVYLQICATISPQSVLERFPHPPKRFSSLNLQPSSSRKPHNLLSVSVD